MAATRRPGGFDAALCFDVVEHVDDPVAFLQRLEARASLVVVNLLEPDPDDTHLHRPLPVRRLLDRATRMGLVHHHRYGGRSHLLAYRTDGTVPRRDSLRARWEGHKDILAERLTGLPRRLG